MKRIIIYSHLDTPLGDLSTNDVLSCIRREEINGEHSLEITTTQVLEKGQRVLYKDGRGVWREYVVAGVDENHNAGRTVIGTYYCVWSIQYDLLGVTVSAMPGVQTPVVARLALEAALSTQSRWTVGTVTQNTEAGASMYDMNAWNAMGVLVDNWGGELSVTITVSESQGVVLTRAVNLLAHEGSETPNRRFDFGADLKSIKRSMPDDPLYCRVSPRGKGEATEGGGYGRKITIESVNGGKDYLEYTPMVDVAKIPNGAGGYQYPTLIIENSSCETPADLKTWAQSVMADVLTPKVTYTVDVIQAAREGIDLQGVSLGDAVDVVDRKFRSDGLRVAGRAVAVAVNEISGKNDALEIGAMTEKLASKFADAGKEAMDAVMQLEASLSTAAYIEDLVARINADINATGGYTYIIPGNGIRTYDTAVSDPLVGAEASAVVEIKGGTIRIANTKTDGAWDWKTVFSAGFIASDVITANNILAGTMSADRIHGGTLAIGGANNVNGVIQVLDASGNVISQFDNTGASISGELVLRSRHEDYPGATGTNFTTSITKNGVISVADSDLYELLTGGILAVSQAYLQGLKISTFDSTGTTELNYFMFLPAKSTNSIYWSSIVSSNGLNIIGNYANATHGYLSLRSGASIISETNYQTKSYCAASGSGTLTAYGNSGVSLKANSTSTIGVTFDGISYNLYEFSTSALSVGRNNSYQHANLTVYGNLSVSGTKPRLVKTPNYNERFLYAYETPSPMFGDIGSGTIGDDGYCYVEIDDIFSETARADLAYQVFLQACGEGSLYVESKAFTHFVVRGTPGLKFDWEVKCKQRDYEALRMEQPDLDPANIRGVDINESEFGYTDYISEIEKAYA